MTQEAPVDFVKKQGTRLMNAILSSPKLYRLAGKMGRQTLRFAPFLVNNALNPWYKQRDMPDAPKDSFRDWYIKNR